MTIEQRHLYVFKPHRKEIGSSVYSLGLCDFNEDDGCHGPDVARKTCGRAELYSSEDGYGCRQYLKDDNGDYHYLTGPCWIRKIGSYQLVSDDSTHTTENDILCAR